MSDFLNLERKFKCRLDFYHRFLIAFSDGVTQNHPVSLNIFTLTDST